MSYHYGSTSPHPDTDEMAESSYTWIRPSWSAMDSLAQNEAVPACLASIFPSSFSQLQFHPVPMDGDCLFSCFRLILEKAPSDFSRLSQLKAQITTTEDVRKLVAQSLMEDNPFINNTIKFWLEMTQGAIKEKNMDLLREYGFISSLVSHPWPWTVATRRILAQNVMSRTFWGEQFALRILEEQTHLRCLIINADQHCFPSINWYHSDQFQQEGYCLLYLSGQHYSLLSWRQQCVFRWAEIPNDIKAFMFKAWEHHKPTRPPSAAHPE